MQYETIRAAICDDEEFFRNELKKFVSEYGNEMDINVSIDLYDNAKELMNNILSKRKEYDLLFYLVENRNIALSRDQLITNVWGYDYYGDDRTLDTHIKRLRSSLEEYRSCIVTLRGVGYRFDDHI